MSIASINPATNEPLETYTSLSKDDVLAAIGRSHSAYRKWRTTTFDQRKECLLKFAELLRADADEYARTITLDMGKRISESRYEIEYCANIAEFYANGAEKFLADQTMELEDVNAYIRYEPLGILLGVMPWNFPFYQVIRFATPNIMAGNTVMVKHASNVPQCAYAIEGLFTRCGLPDDVYTNLFIPSDLVEAIVSDKRVQGVSLTGSEGAYFNPTILTHVMPDNPTFDQELFGPVATIYVVKDEAAAIELANKSSYGLGGSVFTTDIERGRRVAEQVETGMMFLNQPTQSRAELPFGGIKNSGYGRELSHLGILEFVNKKLIHLGN